VDQGWRPAPQATASGYRMATGYNRGDKTMTAQEFAAKLEALIVEAKGSGTVGRRYSHLAAGRRRRKAAAHARKTPQAVASIGSEVAHPIGQRYGARMNPL
jgi:hypothetical protein